MKRYSSVVLFLAIVLLFGLSSGAWSATIAWSNPTTYTDAAPISAAAQATLTTKLYHSTTSAGCATGTLFQTVLNGASSWTGAALPVTAKGSTTYYCATSTVPAEGTESDKSPAVAYTVPLVAPTAPVLINIAK